MEYLFPPHNYWVLLLLEIIVYSVFVFIVFSKSTGEVYRRWNASVFVAGLIGIFIHSSIIGLGWLGWFMKLNLSTFVNDIIQFSNDLMPVSIAMASLITMPIIILGTFFAYARFKQFGDYYIDKYWRNPKVHYNSNHKPPFHNL
jgi:hypothetical protein